MATEHPEKTDFKKSLIEKHFLSYPQMDWQILAQACEYYKNHGFINMETPWLIPNEYSNYTKPHTDKSFIFSNGMFEKSEHELVGSAEQGFIYLYLNNYLEEKNYYSVSPCFRVDDYDNLHYPWFMKLELFKPIKKENSVALDDIIICAFDFFKQHAKGNLIISQMEKDMFDINLNGIEIGSYGIREVENRYYVYGTGLALPRFTLSQK